MKKWLIIIISSIALVAAVAVTLVLVLMPKNNNTNDNERLLDSARSIKIVQITGSGSVSDEDGSYNCYKGMNLYDGDTLDVASNSVIVIKFDQDKYAYLDENTTAVIKASGTDKTKTNIFVKKGKVLAEIQNKLGEDEEFFLSSNNSVMAVRGTVFGIEVKEEGDYIIEIYSIYRGTTELFVFDISGDNIIKGKLSDLSNSKYEIRIPKSHLISDSDFMTLISNWLTDINTTYNDEDDANSNLFEVRILKSNTTKADYQYVIDLIGESSVSYSSISYTSKGYFGLYDGESHKITIDVNTPNAKVYYKDETLTEYQEENTFEYTTPGTYRVYYKIVCEGYDDKEDFEVIQISKETLNVTYTNELTINKTLVKGMPLSSVFEGINLFNFVSITGLDKDKNTILNSTFNFEGNLIEGTNTYTILLVLPDSISECYKEVELEFSLTAQDITIYSTNSISNSILTLNNTNKFNKYNGVDEGSLFGSMVLYSGGVELEGYNSISFNYDSLVDGYFELVDGLNTLPVVISYDDYSIETDLTFTFNDTRLSKTISLAINENIITNMGNNYYFYMLNSGNLVEENAIISGADLVDAFGITESDIYINIDTDVLDDMASNYTINNNFTFAQDEVSKVTFTIFPTMTSKGTNVEVNVYFSTTEPQIPTYTVLDTSLFKLGEEITFIESEDDVLYSLDDINYVSSLVINEEGTYNVYYKVGSSFVINGEKEISVEKAKITSDNLSLISDSLSVLSNDNFTIQYQYTEEGELAVSTTYTLEAENGETISPIQSLRTIYEDILKNSKYYDSFTKEELNVDVNIVEASGNNLFDYTISCQGYDDISGSVSFNYLNLSSESSYDDGKYEFNSGYSTELSVIIPSDVEISLADTQSINAQQIIFTNGDITTFSNIYSIDNGMTWTTIPPRFDTVGEYIVYCIYEFSPSSSESAMPSGNHIIVSIQKIVVTE